MTAKERLKKIRESFFKQKYRFDLGYSFMVFLNFTLLIVTASDKLKTAFDIPSIKELLIILVPMGFLGMWVMGYILDRFVKSQHYQENESISRSPAWTKLYARLDEIEKKIDEGKKHGL